jgi:probable phosphoglycerate mutase
VQAWKIPSLLRQARWFTSPLARAKDTVAVLGHAEAQIEPALIEMDWGDWEGKTREELIAEFGSELLDCNPFGRDFRPPNGESPREIWDRLSSWIPTVAELGKPVVAVTHRGVIRAAYAEATGWDMVGPAPHELTANAAHLFLARTDGSMGLLRANLMLS